MPINRYICPYFSIVHKKNTNEYYGNATKWWFSTYSCPSKCVACCNVTYLSDISKMFSKFTNVVQNGCFWCPRYWLGFGGQIGEDFSLILRASNIVTIVHGVLAYCKCPNEKNIMKSSSNVPIIRYFSIIISH